MASESLSDDDRLISVCRALAHPVRLAIVRYVQRHPRCIGNQIQLHLPAPLARAQSTLSQHLKILCASGVLRAESEGPATCYVINQAQLDWLCQQIGGLRD
ncbi:MAG: helix-turn-helix domain-containing protein [Roseiflexaceae bacterium]|nr:helix-turn-helix domain-containing protein [Roseiflexus sp.]MDW8148876.1 helix-turn-helix domain-containing protein [Roseiflexaceae bacterium]MDW8214763.1 helix-turn-helix domain-containing protein [Roseiflexaceae bacterium]